MKRLPLLAILSIPTLCSAQQSNEIDTELEDQSGEYAECAAYYELVYHAMVSAGEKAAANSYREIYDSAMLYSLLLANEGRDQELASEVTTSRIEMYIQKMKREANNQAENISILINKYHFQCQDLLENPSPQVQSILERRMRDIVD